MMLAVSMENKAVKRMLARPRRSSSEPIPDQPVWVSIPPSVLQKPETFPAGTQLFAKALQNSDTVTLSVGPNGQSFRAMLTVTCRSAEEAVLLEAQFEKVTEVLRKLIAANQQQPNPKDLSGVLTSGAFRREDRRVLGNWPIEKAFLENMVGGTF
jgi:hypothetical protein